MSDDYWFEEELIPIVEEHSPTKLISIFEQPEQKEDFESAVKGIVRVDTPRWKFLNGDERNYLTSGSDSRFILIRLGFQFDVLPEAKLKGTRFIEARCQASLLAPQNEAAILRVYDMFPKDIYEGQRRTVNVRFGPKIKVGPVDGSLGEVGTNLELGEVEPVIIGYPGEEERQPYWDLRPRDKPLMGWRHLWLVLETSLKEEKIGLLVSAEGLVQTKWGPIPLSGKIRQRQERPTILIG